MERERHVFVLNMKIHFLKAVNQQSVSGITEVILRKRILSTHLTRVYSLSGTLTSNTKHSKHSKSDWTRLPRGEEQPSGSRIVGFKGILFIFMSCVAYL